VWIETEDGALIQGSHVQMLQIASEPVEGHPALRPAEALTALRLMAWLVTGDAVAVARASRPVLARVLERIQNSVELETGAPVLRAVALIEHACEELAFEQD
jgi:hypothetical protein